MNDTALSDGYVECSECGHLLERHTRKGCGAVDECTCQSSWTVAQVSEARKRAGLPAKFRPYV